jgi:hypothetical protein
MLSPFLIFALQIKMLRREVVFVERLVISTELTPASLITLFQRFARANLTHVNFLDSQRLLNPRIRQLE